MPYCKLIPILFENSGSYRREKTEKPQPDQYNSLKINAFFWLCFASVFLLLLACSPPDRNSRRRTPASRVLTDRLGDRFRNDRPSRISSGNCRSREDAYSDIVSITDADFVDSNNVGYYELEGRCQRENAFVWITVNDYPSHPPPKCNRGRWETSLDLTDPLITEKKIVTFYVIHDKEEVCKEVRVAFQGPENYIPIPPLEDYSESGFYVMKYEAKVKERISSARAVSEPEDRPTTFISHEDAENRCRNNGGRYRLMKNTEWQTIARHIESMDENWSQSRAIPSDNNKLNCGARSSSPREASRSDDDDCAASSCGAGWHESRRTHFLPNGEKIWDMCGNVGEIMLDEYRGRESFKDFIYQLGRDLKRKFGPKKNYRIVNANRRSNSWNLGYANINSKNNLIVRGLPGRDLGIFSVDITDDQESRRGYSGNIGFRCVYIP